MQHISVVSIPVSDQERARAFYVERLGLEVIADTTFGDDLRWVQLGFHGAATSITLVTWFDEMPAGSLRGLVVDCEDIDAEHRRLSERGVPFLGPPAPQPGGIFCMFRDPDGNVIALHQADGTP